MSESKRDTIKPTIGLVHTSATIVPLFQGLLSEGLPGADVFNIVDDSLIKDVIRRGELTPETARRAVEHVGSAARAGADVVMVTCSSIGAAAEAAAPLTPVPVLRVDQEMADQAVAAGHRVGVIATLATTLGPTADLVRRRAARAGREIELRDRLCDGAFDALMSGDTERHDTMVAEALRELASEVDVIMLAQASMARVVEQLPPDERRVPILASPPHAIAHLKRILAN